MSNNSSSEQAKGVTSTTLGRRGSLSRSSPQRRQRLSETFAEAGGMAVEMAASELDKLRAAVKGGVSGTDSIGKKKNLVDILTDMGRGADAHLHAEPLSPNASFKRQGRRRSLASTGAESPISNVQPISSVPPPLKQSTIRSTRSGSAGSPLSAPHIKLFGAEGPNNSTETLHSADSQPLSGRHGARRHSISATRPVPKLFDSPPANVQAAKPPSPHSISKHYRQRSASLDRRGNPARSPRGTLTPGLFEAPPEPRLSPRLSPRADSDKSLGHAIPRRGSFTSNKSGGGTIPRRGSFTSRGSSAEGHGRTPSRKASILESARRDTQETANVGFVFRSVQDMPAAAADDEGAEQESQEDSQPQGLGLSMTGGAPGGVSSLLSSRAQKKRY